MFIVNISGAPTSYTNIQTNYCNLDNPTKKKIRSRDRPSICLTFPTQKKKTIPATCSPISINLIKPNIYEYQLVQ